MQVKPKENRRPFWLHRFAFGVGAWLMALHGLVVTSQATNIPYWDEWALFRPNNLTFRLHTAWLVELHNEHRLFFTKLTAWFLYRLTTLNLASQVGYNFLLWMLLCAMLIAFARRVTSIWPGFALIALASVIPHEVHYWSFQSHFHVYLIFFISGLYAFLQQGWSQWSWPLFLGLSCYSFSAGVPCAVVMALVVLFVAGLRVEGRRSLIAQASIMLLIVRYWFIGFATNPAHPPFALPHRTLFWRTLFAALARGFGWGGRHVERIGAVLFVFLVFLLWGELKKLWQSRGERRESAAALIFAGGALAGIAQTAMARANFFPDVSMTPSRYLEGVLILVPLVGALALSRARGRAVVQLGIICLLLAPFVDKFAFVRTYAQDHATMQDNQACVRDALAGAGPTYCPKAFPIDLSPFLACAKELRVSFVDELLPPLRAAEAPKKAYPIRGDVCSLITINGRGPIEPGVFRVGGGEAGLAVEGRLVDTGAERVLPPDVEVALIAPDGARWLLAGRRRMGGAKRGPFGLAHSGDTFVTHYQGPLAFPAGRYTLETEFGSEGQTYRCPTRYVLEVVSESEA